MPTSRRLIKKPPSSDSDNVPELQRGVDHEAIAAEKISPFNVKMKQKIEEPKVDKLSRLAPSEKDMYNYHIASRNMMRKREIESRRYKDKNNDGALPRNLGNRWRSLPKKKVVTTEIEKKEEVYAKPVRR